ncbi:hypothetical protein ARTHRO8AJ_40187 [Arthrobacter sp. 8AJ]|nr:hypothetical protein ARTHRO8AJ_40187 [Arthrobacter sp. 8AJ]
MISTARLSKPGADLRSSGQACCGDVPNPVLSESPITTTLAMSIDIVSCTGQSTPAGAHALIATSSAAPAAVLLFRDDCSIYCSNNFSTTQVNPSLARGSKPTVAEASKGPITLFHLYKRANYRRFSSTGESTSKRSCSGITAGLI